MTYLFPLATAVSTVNGWAVGCVTNPLQDCCFSCICSSYDEDSELDRWNMAGLFRIHCFRIDWRASDRVRNRFKTSSSWFKRSGSHAYQAVCYRYRCDSSIHQFHPSSRYQPNDSHLTGPEDYLNAKYELLSPQFYHMIMVVFFPQFRVNVIH